jgi:hypothetical protein
LGIPKIEDSYNKKMKIPEYPGKEGAHEYGRAFKKIIENFSR